jgi:hypothetical protein
MAEKGALDRVARAERLADRERQLVDDERSGAALERQRADKALEASREEEQPD